MRQIIHFMRLCLENKEIPQSWGISNIETSKNKLSFDVFGSKFQGKITIIEYNSIMVVKKNNVEIKFSTSNEMFSWLDKSIE